MTCEKCGEVARYGDRVCRNCLTRLSYNSQLPKPAEPQLTQPQLTQYRWAIDYKVDSTGEWVRHNDYTAESEARTAAMTLQKDNPTLHQIRIRKVVSEPSFSEDNKLRKDVDDLIRKGKTGEALAKAVDAAENGEKLEPSVKSKLEKATKKVVGKSKDILKKMFEGVEKFSGDEWVDLEDWAKQAVASGSHYFGFDGELFYLADTPGPHMNEGDEGVLKWHKVGSPDDVMRMAKVIATPEMNPDMCRVCQGRGDQAGEWCSACEGRGFQYKEVEPVEEDKQKSGNCKTCNMTGWLEDQERFCSVCGGKGYVSSTTSKE